MRRYFGVMVLVLPVFGNVLERRKRVKGGSELVQHFINRMPSNAYLISVSPDARVRDDTFAF